MSHENREFPLNAYLCPRMSLHAALAVQRRWVYEVSGHRDHAMLLLTEHPTMITLGREGSLSQIRLSDAELHARGWEVHFLARGGGLSLLTAGQVVAYFVAPSEHVGPTPADAIRRVGDVNRRVVESFGLLADWDWVHPGIRVRGRRLVQMGLAMRSGVTAFGWLVNVSADLELWHGLECDGDTKPMTSLERECVQPVRPATVRQRYLEYLSEEFGFSRTTLFHDHPDFPPVRSAHASFPERSG
ncbi:MAG: lipoyl protein ligase domain-containing protein [Fimbriiglobus sp.]